MKIYFAHGHGGITRGPDGVALPRLLVSYAAENILLVLKYYAGVVPRGQ